MIKVIDRTLQIPSAETHIGFIGDNLIESRQFEITESRLFDFNFKLEIKMGLLSGIIEPEKTVEDNRVILTWDIKEEHLPSSGTVSAQLRAFDDNNIQKWHSETKTDAFYVGESLNASGSFPSPLPSEFEQMESRITGMKNDVDAKAAEVEDGRSEVATNKQTVLDKAAEALQSAANALDSANKAKTSEESSAESKASALQSMQTAVQAMQDLLSMLGTDIATLTDGKLTPSQIPAIAVTDRFVVNSEAAMLALEAQTGDICIRTDESKTYILSGDPTVLLNWQQMLSPTDYSDTAGYATTAGTAEDSQKINGHRVVYMTQTQYESAVKDPDTVYMVGVE